MLSRKLDRIIETVHRDAPRALHSRVRWESLMSIVSRTASTRSLSSNNGQNTASTGSIRSTEPQKYCECLVAASKVISNLEIPEVQAVSRVQSPKIMRVLAVWAVSNPKILPRKGWALGSMYWQYNSIIPSQYNFQRFSKYNKIAGDSSRGAGGHDGGHPSER